MDNVLIDYLKSGKAWILIGSGPSIEMGYSDWKSLADHAIELIKIEEQSSTYLNVIDSYDNNNFTEVFEKVAQVVGIKRLIKYLEENLKTVQQGKIYELIVRWPVQVFLTTNYDDEIQKHLVKLGISYKSFNNSEDNMSYLLPDFSGGIIKLHGDLRSERGLILTNLRNGNTGVQK